MCKTLKISRSHYYNYKDEKMIKDPMSKDIKGAFSASKNTNGTRRIKAEIAKKGYTVSRRRIGRIMSV